MGVSYQANKTQGHEHDLPCIKCSGKTSHKVLASAELRGSDVNGGYSFDWWTDYQVVQCQGCRSISFRQASSNSESHFQVGPDDWEYDVAEKLYPRRIEGMKALGDDEAYLPSKVKQIYSEAVDALASQSLILAGIGLRALLEAVCKDRNAQGSNLYKQIDDLVEQRVLTPGSAQVLHKIRALGNAAAHEVKPHSEKQLALAMGIIEHLLKDVYILPKHAELGFPEETK